MYVAVYVCVDGWNIGRNVVAWIEFCMSWILDVYTWVTRLKFKAKFDIVSVDLWMKVNANKWPCNEKVM